MGFLPATNVFWILYNVLEILVLLVLAEVVVSWAMYFGARGVSPYHPWVRTLRRITNPILEPFRRLLPPNRFRGLDLSPLLAIVVIEIIQSILRQAGVNALLGR